jgi:hypothetical protein
MEKVSLRGNGASILKPKGVKRVNADRRLPRSFKVYSVSLDAETEQNNREAERRLKDTIRQLQAEKQAEIDSRNAIRDSYDLYMVQNEK